jgi:hypothetical protein
VEPIRERIEEFLQRYWHEQNRVVRVLGVAVAILLALLLALRWLRVLRVLAVPVLVGAILVVGWLLFGPLRTIPRFTTEGRVVRNGVAVIVACGKEERVRANGCGDEVRPRASDGHVGVRAKGRLHRVASPPPDATRREARHERAVQSQTSGDRKEFVWA